MRKEQTIDLMTSRWEEVSSHIDILIANEVHTQVKCQLTLMKAFTLGGLAGKSARAAESC